MAGVIARSLGIPLEFLRGLDLGAADDGDDDDGEDGPAGSMGPMPGGMPFPIMPAPPTDGAHPGGSIFSDN